MDASNVEQSLLEIKTRLGEISSTVRHVEADLVEVSQSALCLFGYGINFFK